jgi:hypothetical protein
MLLFKDFFGYQEVYMKFSLAGRSMLLFGLCVVILVVMTRAESALGVMSFTAQRIITFLGFVLPAGVGSVLGVMSLVRREDRPWLATAGIVLNGLFAMFHIMIIIFAG